MKQPDPTVWRDGYGKFVWVSLPERREIGLERVAFRGFSRTREPTAARLLMLRTELAVDFGSGTRRNLHAPRGPKSEGTDLWKPGAQHIRP